MSALRLLDVTALFLGAALALLALRRLILLVASMGRPIRVPSLTTSELPSVTLMVPAHDEEPSGQALLRALEELDYPRDRLSIVLVSDGSTDGTAELFSRWCGGQEHAQTIALRERVGKAIALNEGLAVAGGSVIAVLDADMRPHAGFLRHTAAAFQDPGVGGVAGYIRPVDPDASPMSRYAAAETWVHQLVKSAGKERLRLNPPTLGAAAYRKAALDQIGGFPVVPHGVDVAVTVALTHAGWTTRFIPEAVVETGLIRTVREYWTQHLRWSRGSFAALSARPAQAMRPARVVSSGVTSSRLRLRRLEAWVMCANYADRILLLGALAVAALGALPFWLPVGYLLMPALETWAAVSRAEVAGRGRYMIWTVLLFPFDAASSVAAAMIHAARRPARWRSPERHAAPGPPVGTLP
jgi:cellulose synthase/poly-beta-1,6-N-acetylglucosamine synthase-like glycosyltransferase